MRVRGSELQVGDTIGGLWWRPYRDVIVSLRPHSKPLVPGQRVAEFGIRMGLTIFPDDFFELIHRPQDRIILVPVPVFIPQERKP